MLADAVDDLDVNGEERSKAKYMRVLRKVANRQSAAVVIDLNDVKEVRYCLTSIMRRRADKQHTHDASLLVNITRNTRRYIQLFAEVIDKIMPEPDHEVDHTTDVLDVIMDSRRMLNEQLTSGENGDPNIFPPELMRR